MTYQQCEVPLGQTTVRCCRCYSDYWKFLKGQKTAHIAFDYSIEKAFFYRKYFNEEGILYHFCINCLYELTATVPMVLISFEIQTKVCGLCLWRFKQNRIPLGEVCSACVDAVLQHIGSRFFEHV